MNEDPQDNFRSKLNLSDPVHLIAVGFGSGLAKKAPGTMGTLAALPIVAVMWGLLDGETINFRQILATIVILIGVYFANRRSRST